MEFLNQPLFGIITELNYNQKGMKVELPLTTPHDPGGSSGKTKSVSNRIDYLSFTVESKFKFNMSTLKPYVFAGPRVDISLNKNVDKNFDMIYDALKNQVFGLSVGIGSEFDRILPVNLFVELQYNHDLTLSYESELYEIKNNSVDFKIGIKF